ncbi:MAG: 2'-5' RNA ligase [Acidobacteria bacterium RIFCSPHIGHO2_01_FULL_67_28]|nr:MAG: 2'-5' RNA ligase [Acidobacteria bacterium RIFCSPHIGHO2_01_FULL_67_28]
MRLFVALELTEGVRAALRELVARLEPAGADLRWVRPQGMHLTLKFIGETPEAKLPLLREALARVRSPKPVEMEFHGLGYFPNERRPRVFWVGIEASDNLPALAAEVEAALEPLGIPRESRPFAPHLTLGRFKSANRLEGLQQEIARLPATQFGRVETSEFVLFQSRLSPHWAEYTRLESFPFVRS